jgi:hypothetical protein
LRGSSRAVVVIVIDTASVFRACTGASSFGFFAIAGSGAAGGGDDLAAKQFGGEWWAHLGQNVWKKVDAANPSALLAPLTGGGPNENPAATPGLPVYRHTDGKYFIGPITSGGEAFYYGDKLTGGDGKLNSTYTAQHGTDDKYYLINGAMVPQGSYRVDRVEITPASATVMKGGAQSFTARVIMSVGPDDASGVTWELKSHETYLSAGTGFNASTGVLTVASDEGNTQLALVATSVRDGTKKATVVIKITDDPGAIKSIAISGPSGVTQGKTGAFTATVTRNDGNPDAAGVTWSLTGAAKAGTAIDPDTGVLTVAADEPATSVLTVKAVSKTDPSIYSTKAVSVSPSLSIPNGVYTDSNGILWLVLEDDGNGNKLIMTHYVYLYAANNSPQYNSSGDWVKYENATLAGTIQAWFDNNAGSEIKAAARGFTEAYEFTAPNTDWLKWMNVKYWEASGLSQATGPVGQGKPFPLSISEFNKYLIDNSTYLQKIGHDANNKAMPRDWWLRTPTNAGGVAISRGMDSIQGGQISQDAVTSRKVGIRPAVWVAE